MLPRPDPAQYPPFYGGYVAEVPDGDVLDLLAHQHALTVATLQRVEPERETFRYAPGKWSVREIAGHLADSERVFTYRALRFARNDPTPLPGFDENAWVLPGVFDRRALRDLVGELAAVRTATRALFDSFDAAAWTRSGEANGASIVVAAIPWIILGHERHHVRVLRERYGIVVG